MTLKNNPTQLEIQAAIRDLETCLTSIPDGHVFISDGAGVIGENPANTEYGDESLRRVTYTTDDIQPGDPSPYQPGTLTCVYE